MKPLICVKCRQRYSRFITKIESRYIMLRNDKGMECCITVNSPVAICSTCGSMMWCEEFEKIHIEKYEAAIKNIKGEKWYEVVDR